MDDLLTLNSEEPIFCMILNAIGLHLAAAIN